MPFLDRTVLKFSHTSSPPKFDHPELKSLPLKLGASSSIDEQKKKICAEMLKISPDQVEKLKKKANIEREGSSSRPYSRFEAIAAHIWRCACKARELDENQLTAIRFHASIRTRVIPPLPKNYFGNALARVTPKCHVGEILSNPFGYVAHKIREAIGVLSNEYIRSQLSAEINQEKLDGIKSVFLGKGEPMYIPIGGNLNLRLTCWIGMPVYEADFGWGKPMHFGVAYVISSNRALILPSPDEDGSILVCILFQTAHMQLFKKFFYEDL
jgi:shikimate O-hydroxycinnamoyltransferase